MRVNVWVTLKNLLLKCNGLGEELKYLFDNKRWFSGSRTKRQVLNTLLDGVCNIFKIRCILKKFGISSSSFWRLKIFKAWFSILTYFYFLPQNYWIRNSLFFTLLITISGNIASEFRTYKNDISLLDVLIHWH